MLRIPVETCTEQVRCIAKCNETSC